MIPKPTTCAEYGGDLSADEKEFFAEIKATPVCSQCISDLLADFETD